MAEPSLPATKRAHHIVDRTGPNWDESGNYKVGRGRPPAAHRWAKGQSGNPRGPKPREKLDPAAEFEKAVLDPFVAKINGEDVTLNLGTFGLQLVKGKAAKGDRKAMEYLINLYLSKLRHLAPNDTDEAVRDDERAIIDAMLEASGFRTLPVHRDTERASTASSGASGDDDNDDPQDEDDSEDGYGAEEDDA